MASITTSPYIARQIPFDAYKYELLTFLETPAVLYTRLALFRRFISYEAPRPVPNSRLRISRFFVPSDQRPRSYQYHRYKDTANTGTGGCSIYQKVG